MIPNFRAGYFEFTFEPQEPLSLPFYKGGVLRGGFGYAFREIVCVTGAARVRGAKDPCRSCLLLHQCPYPYLFETPLPPDSEVLRTNRYIPHPFILRPLLSTEREFQPGEPFRFGLVLAGRALQFLSYFVIAYQRLGERGLGKDRARAVLQSVESAHPWSQERTTLYTASRPQILPNPHELSWNDIQQRAEAFNPQRLSIQFLTPTRLVHAKRVADQPEFHVLLRVLLRRLSSIAYFHFGARWQADYAGLVDRAQAVKIDSSDIHWVDWERWSTRQQQRMNLGGIIGQVTYTGDIAEFLPILAAGELLHAGKATVFGHGQYQVTAL